MLIFPWISHSASGGRHIPAVSVEFLALRGREGEKRREGGRPCAEASGRVRESFTLHGKALTVTDDCQGLCCTYKFEFVYQFSISSKTWER